MKNKELPEGFRRIDIKKISLFILFTFAVYTNGRIEGTFRPLLDIVNASSKVMTLVELIAAAVLILIGLQLVRKINWFEESRK